MNRTLVLLCSFLLSGLAAFGQILPVNKQLLSDLRDKYKAGDTEAVGVVAQYERSAQKYMEGSLPTVTKKKKLPPSNDKRDYMSLSRYWWPDSTKADGLPYVRHDGQVNPEINLYPDFTGANNMDTGVKLLSMLYYVTGKEDYAERTAQYLRTWFLDSVKGMNPNMVFSQYIPGRKTLRGTGLLDGRHMARAVCFAQLLDGSPAWTDKDKKELRAWAEAYCYWYEHSTQGHKEHQAKNNHGLWYDVTHLLLRSALGDSDVVRQIIANDMLGRLDTQMAQDGSLPQELARTLSLHYSTFVMEALTEANYVARQLGMDIWTNPMPSGRKAVECLNFLLPYYKQPSKWTHKQISPFDVRRTAIILYEAGVSTGNKQFLAQAKATGIAKSNKSPEAMPYLLLREK